MPPFEVWSSIVAAHRSTRLGGISSIDCGNSPARVPSNRSMEYKLENANMHTSAK
jgi:hypothetical protein